MEAPMRTWCAARQYQRRPWWNRNTCVRRTLMVGRWTGLSQAMASVGLWTDSPRAKYGAVPDADTSAVGWLARGKRGQSAMRDSGAYRNRIGPQLDMTDGLFCRTFHADPPQISCRKHSLPLLCQVGKVGARPLPIRKHPQRPFALWTKHQQISIRLLTSSHRTG